LGDRISSPIFTSISLSMKASATIGSSPFPFARLRARAFSTDNSCASLRRWASSFSSDATTTPEPPMIDAGAM